MSAVAADLIEDLRSDSTRRFAAEPDPLPTVEAWRRTEFKRFGLDAWRPGVEAASPGAVTARDEEPVPYGASGDEDLGGFLFQKGAGRPVSRVCAELAPRGVIVSDLESAAHRWPDLVRPHLAFGPAAPEYRKLGLANAAGWRGGAFVYVPKGVRCATPVKLTFQANGAFSFPRVLVVAEAGAEVSVWEEHLGGEASTSVARSTLSVGDGAAVSYYYTQELGPARSFWSQRCVLGRDSKLTHASVVLGGDLHKSFLEVENAGRGSRADLCGVLLGSGDQIFDVQTCQRGSADHTYSDLLFRAALKDRSRSIYTGLIRLEPAAKESEAYQANHNLLLSREARADSTPILEILADSVRCKHGATAGPLAKDELFYLAARGIPEEEARRMLILGFFEPVLRRLPLASARERLARKIEASL